MAVWLANKKPISTYGGPQLETVWRKMFPKGHSHRGRDSSMLAAHMRNDAQDAIDVVYAMLCYRSTAGPFDVPNFIKWARRLRADFDGIPSEHKAVEVAAQIAQTPVPVEVWIYLELKDDGAGHYREEFERARQVADEYLTAVLA